MFFNTYDYCEYKTHDKKSIEPPKPNECSVNCCSNRHRRIEQQIVNVLFHINDDSVIFTVISNTLSLLPQTVAQ